VHRLSQSVLRYIRKQKLMRAGDRVAVAVSGGADSVALLRMALEWREEIGIVLSAAHFNHKIRGAESDSDEQFVRKLALQHQLTLFCEGGDAKAHAAANKLSLETSARDLRYGFFDRLLGSAEVNRITTGHTLDDQAETVLFKLTRGAGTRGLAGVYPKISLQQTAVGSQQSAIVRPLLATRRVEIEAYLQGIDQPWREDLSNRDLQHARNRIRHEVLPRLQALNPCVRETLAEVAEIARVEEDFWAEQVTRMLARCWNKDEQGGRLDLSLLRDVPLAMQRRVVRAAGESLGLNLEFCHVEEILALSNDGAQSALPDGYIAALHRNEIKLQFGTKALAEYSYAITVPGQVELNQAGVVIEALFVSTGENAQTQGSVLRPEVAEKELLIRNWRAGDRFWPAHTKEPKKLKELLQDLHISGEEKRLWPVISAGDEVIWVRKLGARRDVQAKNGAGVLIREGSIAK
jgi:tRNA(Ile)-lysidine synthase